MTQSPGENRIKSELQSSDWVPPPPPLDIDAILATSKQRRRRSTVAVAASVSIAAVALGATGSALMSRTESHPQPSTSPTDRDAVAWIGERPRVVESESAPECTQDQLSTTLGRTGAWEGNATQAIQLANVSASPCEVPALVTVSREASSERTELAASSDERMLAPGQEATLLVGSPAACPGVEPVTVNLKVQLGNNEPFAVESAAVTDGCGPVRALLVSAEPAEPATESVRLAASLIDVGPATSDSPLPFLVQLTNRSDEAVVFGDCPTYQISLKPAGVSEEYVLNCQANSELAPGEQVLFEMQLLMPVGTRGQQTLTWILEGYRAVATRSLDVS